MPNNQIQSQQPQQNQQPEDSVVITDFLYLCLRKWWWFVIALVVAFGIAIAYILRTPPVYTRTESIVVSNSDDSQSMSIDDIFSSASSGGIGTSNNYVNNELLALQSPSIMLEVVKRLGLNVTYLTDSTFYKGVLYGQDMPYTVSMPDVQDEDVVKFTVKMEGTRFVLSEFVRDKEELDGEDIIAKLNQTVHTPIGRVTIKPSHYYNSWPGGLHANLYVTHVPMMSAMSYYQKGLSVSLADNKASVINLEMQDVNIQRSEDILNTIIAVYKDRWVRDKNQVAVATSAFIDDRLKKIELELGNVDNSISSFKSKNLITDVDAVATSYLDQSTAANAKLLDLNTQRAMAQYVLSYITNPKQRNHVLPANFGLTDQNIEQQIESYNKDLIERNQLLANSSEANPLVKDLDQSLRLQRSSIITSVENSIRSLDNQIGAYGSQESTNNAKMAASPTQAKYLLSVERQQKVKEQLYVFLLQKREENELSKAFTAYNTRIITPPMGDDKPTSPVKRRIYLLAFAIGLIVPGGILFLKESTNTKLRGRKDLERISIPFAGEIPECQPERGGKLWKKPKLSSPLVVAEGNRDIVNEAFRVFRTNLEFMIGKGDHSQVIIVTSFNPGSGKSFISGNLAISLAIKNKKVLLIDGDLRHGSTSHMFGTFHHGLCDFLAGKTDDIDQYIYNYQGQANLKVLPIGHIPPNPTELVEGGRFPELIKRFREEYDYVLIDCPPIEIVADTQIIEKWADRTIFVVRAGLLERSMLPELEALYTEKKFKNMSLVLNGTVSVGSHYGYRYGYHYGYGSNSYYGNGADNK